MFSLPHILLLLLLSNVLSQSPLPTSTTFLMRTAIPTSPEIVLPMLSPVQTQYQNVAPSPTAILLPISRKLPTKSARPPPTVIAVPAPSILPTETLKITPSSTDISMPMTSIGPSKSPTVISTPSQTAMQSLAPYASTTTSLPTLVSFNDVFTSSGLARGAPRISLKFGGPCIADLDSDGNYDIILNFHNRNRTRIYMGNGDGTFTLFIDPNTGFPFRTRTLDSHGISVAQLTVTSTDRLIAFSVGGGRGQMPRSAEIYRMTESRGLTDVTSELGLGQIMSRPRNTVFMDMQLKPNWRRRRDGGGPDALFLNVIVPRNDQVQFGYRNIGGVYDLRPSVGEMDLQRWGRVTLTDLDGDAIMEVISIQEFHIYQLNGPFNFIDVTSRVLPPTLNLTVLTVNAVVEFDYDNDGDFDLYVARPIRGGGLDLESADLLLRNDGGVYKDVSEEAGIPKETNSMGVTVGDFDNNGYVDVLVVLRKEIDIVLMNNGDGTFTRVDGLIPKREEDIGDNAIAVDYDLDGALDAIVGHGGKKGPDFGPYLLMKNGLELGAGQHWLHVTVYNDPTGAATSLHAVVTLFVPRRKKLVRRIGGRGGQEAEGSYLDTVHFGLGSRTKIRLIRVRWSSRVISRQRNIAVDQRIFFGKQRL